MERVKTMEIIKVLCPTSKYNIKCPYSMTPEYITVHNTYNDASAMAEISYMIGNNKETSFHYAVDDYRAVQGLPLDRNGWHAGDGNKGNGNRKSIAIEICYSKSGGERFIQAERNGAWLVAQLLKERGWGIDRVKKHQDWSGKYCPHRTLDMGWERFLNIVREYLGQPAVQIKPAPIVPKGYTGDITYQVYSMNIQTCISSWLSEVVNTNGYGGNFGHFISGIRAKCKNGRIHIQTHLKGGNWLSEINSSSYKANDTKNGNSYSGIYGRPIDGVKIWSDEGYVSYRVHLKGRGWLKWVHKADNTSEGYAGIYGNSIDAIQMK